MKTITVLSCLLLVHGALSYCWYNCKDDPPNKSELCGRHECPNYNTVKAYYSEESDWLSRYHIEFEERSYEDTAWVSTSMPVESSDSWWEDLSYTKPTFMKIFRYIQGDNEQGVKINMTVPVIKSHTKGKVEMAFMLPAEYATNPPQPRDSELKTYRVPAGVYYVRSFGGFPYGPMGMIFKSWKNNYKPELEQLLRELKRRNLPYDSSMFFTIGYNEPWKFLNRHNEVSVLKK